MSSRRSRRLSRRKSDSPFEKDPAPSRIRQLRSEIDRSERQPTIAPKMIFLFGVILFMALGLRLVSQYVTGTGLFKPPDSVSEPAVQHSFALPEHPAPGLASNSETESPIVVESRELVVSGRNVYVPMDCWVVVRSPLGWGFFRLTQIGLAAEDRRQQIKCEWRFFRGSASGLESHSNLSGSQTWPAEADIESAESETKYSVPFNCGPIKLVWREFLGISLPDEIPVAIAVAKEQEAARIRRDVADRAWVVNSLADWPANAGLPSLDFVGSPPEPPGL